MMESGKDSAMFQGQVKACRGDKPPQWKSGFVTVSSVENGGFCAKMYLNVMPAHVYSQMNVALSGVTVKSNRVVIEDKRGVGMYVRLMGSKEIEESRRVISRLTPSESTKRNKSEVGAYSGTLNFKSVRSQLKSPPPSETKAMCSSLSTKRNKSEVGVYSGTLNPKSVRSQLKSPPPSETKAMSSSLSTKRNKSEVGVYSGTLNPKSVRSQLKSPPPSETKAMSSSLSWTKIISPKVAGKMGDSGSVNPNGGFSVSRPKRRSLEMEDGDIDKLYNDENQHGSRERNVEYSRGRKMSPGAEIEAINELKANNFYGKNTYLSAGLHIKSSRSRVRDQGPSLANNLSSSMLPIGEGLESLPPTDEENSSAMLPSSDREVENTSDSSIVGFDNLGNTCFINSPLQCLAYLEPLSLDIQTIVQKYGNVLKPVSVNRLLYLLMKDVRRYSAGSNPERVKRILVKLRESMDRRFEANTQQDAHELLSEILDRCHEEVQDLMKMEDEDSSDIEGAKVKLPKTSGLSRYILSPTESNFSWFFKNSFHLQKCKNHTMTREEHDTTMMLALTSQPELHLQDCLDSYFKGSEVEIKCEHCKQQEKATITRKIVRRPRCLILNLLRYCTDNMDAKKKMDKVTIPRFISIADFCTEDAKPPLYMPPTFMSERIGVQPQESDSFDFPNSVNEMMNFTSSSNHPVHIDKEGACNDLKGATQEYFTATSVKSNEQEMAQDIRDKKVGQDAVSSLDQPSMDNDSTFDQMEGASEMTNTSVSSLSLENVSVSLNCGSKVDGEKTGQKGNKCEDESNVVTSTTKCPLPLKKQVVSERVKCRGGSVKDSANYVVETMEEGEMKEALEQCGDLVVPEGDFEDDFAVVGEVDVGEENRLKSPEGATVRPKDPVISFPKLKVNRDGFGVTLNLKDEVIKIDDDNNNIMDAFNETRVGNGDGGGQSPSISIADDELIDLECMGSQMLGGRNIHEYTKAELQSLNVTSLTEYEMLLFGQALSRMAYAKECEAREKDKRNMESSSENFIDDFVYDPSFLEDSGSLVTGVQSISTSGGSFNQLLEVTTSPIKSAKKRVNLNHGGDRSLSSPTTRTRSGQGSLSRGDGIVDDLSLKVPDILEDNMDLSLFCNENLLEDNTEKKRSEARSSSRCESFASSKNLSLVDKCLFCGNVLVGCQCINCPMGEGDFDLGTSDSSILGDGAKPFGDKSEKDVRKDKFVSPGILSDKNDSKPPVVKTDVEAVDRCSKSVKKEQCSSSNQNNAVPFTIDRKILSPTIQNPAFQKPSLDLSLISPSKNKNLVKTRDYSRLRSPSASPKKKSAKSSPLKKGSASKQLKFAEDCKPEKFSTAANGNSAKGLTGGNLQNTPQKPINAELRISTTPDLSEGNVSNYFDPKNVQASSRALDFGDEPDSMHKTTNEQTKSTPTVSIFSTPFNAVSTSTPIFSSSATSTVKSTIFQSPFTSTATDLDTAVSLKVQEEMMEDLDYATPELSTDRISYGACAPYQDGSHRRKANRSLSNILSAAEGKENSVELSQERQARRKRLFHIEQGEADCSYRLVGIVNHHGESLFAGHYTCSSFNLDKQRWYHMDDKLTRETTESSVLRDSTSTGYVFFYMDKDLYESYVNVRKRASSTHRSTKMD